MLVALLILFGIVVLITKSYNSKNTWTELEYSNIDFSIHGVSDADKQLKAALYVGNIQGVREIIKNGACIAV